MGVGRALILEGSLKPLRNAFKNFIHMIFLDTPYDKMVIQALLPKLSGREGQRVNMTKPCGATTCPILGQMLGIYR